VARVSAANPAASGALDALLEQIDSGRVQLSGAGGLLPELIKAVLERGLQAEVAGHLGYEKGDPAAGLCRGRMRNR
jgi:transposase-like protein